MGAEVVRVFLTIITLISPERGGLSHEESCRMLTISEAIVGTEHENTSYTDLISLAFHESRFGINYESTEQIVSPAGACGIYQQIPRYSEPSHLAKPTCEGLQDAWEASYRAVNFLEVLNSRYGNLESAMCHYCGGYRCSPICQEYRDKHIRIKRRVERIYNRTLSVNFDLSIAFGRLINFCTIYR